MLLWISRRFFKRALIKKCVLNFFIRSKSFLKMKTITNLKNKLLILALIGMLIFSAFVSSHAQTYSLSVGSNFSQFNFLNSEGIPIDFMKKGSGTHFQIGSEYRLLDTTKFSTQSSDRAIYFNQHKRLAALLSVLKFDFSLESNQYNAVGDVQNIDFNYQTNFVGLSGGFGFQIPLLAGFSLSAQGRISGQKIIQGNQQISTKFYDLTIDPQFSPIQVMFGYTVELQKKIGEKLGAFVAYQNMKTNHPTNLGSATLNLQPTSLSFGIKILK